MRISRSLLTFAFVADKFQQSGDLISGFEPLFAPILSRHKGKPFEPVQFAKEVSDTWGVKMHPYVALDLAPKLEQQGLLHAVTSGDTTTGYLVLDKGFDFQNIDEQEITSLISDFFAFAQSKASARDVAFSDQELEDALYERLVTMDFLAIVGREQRSYLKARTLSLPTAKEPSQTADEEVSRSLQLDFLCAEFVEYLHKTDAKRFELLADVSSGALLAEVVLGLRSPPQSGQDATGLSLYFDAPFIMNLLGLSDAETKQYAELLLESAKTTGANLRCFSHNIEEIEANIDAPMANLKRHTEVFGPTGRLLMQGTVARAFVMSIRRDVRHAVEAKGISVEDTRSEAIKTNIKYYSASQEDSLGGHLGVYQNIYARLRDAASIANIVRLRGERPRTVSLFSSPAVFVTQNPRLASRAQSYLTREHIHDEDSVPPIVTDRYLAGVLWIAQGGKGSEVSKRKLLANCTSAMLPRRDVVTKMYDFLSKLDAQKAAHFEALITNDRCAFYLMEQTLGDRDLLTLENCAAIYENIERATAEKITLEKDRKIAEIAAEREAEATLANERAAGEQREAARKFDEVAKERDLLRETTEELLQEKAKLNIRSHHDRAKMLAKCVRRGKREELIAILAIALVFATISGGLAIAGSFLWAGAIAAMALGIAFLGFWRIPDLLFSNVLDRVRLRGFRKEALELGLADDPMHLDVDWSKGYVRGYELGRSLTLLGGPDTSN